MGLGYNRIIFSLDELIGSELSMQDIYQMIAEYREQGLCTLATVMEGEYIGEKLLICQGEPVCQTKENGLLQRHLDELKAIEESGIVKLDGIRVFAELFGGTARLVICGAGHVSMPIIQLGKSLGFHITVLEDRPSFADHARRAGADTVICDTFENGLLQVEGSSSAYFVIVTRGHRYDTLCLKSIIEKKNAYIGMMGSHRRVAMVKAQLEEGGISGEMLDAVHAPIGLAIGAETPEEIAVSIMAEIIQCKNQKKHTEGYRDEILDALNFKNAGINQVILAEIMERKGSAPRNIGTKMVIGQDGSLTGTIGGGCMEAEVIQAARQMLANDASDYQIKEVDMTAASAEEEGMVCGGTQLVYLEKRCRS